MAPLPLILNIAIIVGMVGIVVYWVRRFAVFRGYKNIEADVLRLAEFLKAQAVRDGNDVVVAGRLSGVPTIVRFSQSVDTPGLDIQMRVPTTFNLSLLPKMIFTGEGRVVMRTGSAQLDKKFNAQTDHPVEVRMLISGNAVLPSLEQLCCSSQTGLSIKSNSMELTELAIPAFAGNHVLDHLTSMLTVAKAMREMPGADQIKIEPLPQQGSSWTIRVALVGGLASLIALLFIQPYNRSAGANANVSLPAQTSGVAPADAVRMRQLQGWHVAGTNDFSAAAALFLRGHNLAPSGQIKADFTGRGGALDAGYLLIDGKGQRRVSMLAMGVVAYDAIFPQADFLARIPKNNVARIQWATVPQSTADGDALLVIQNANDPTASLVLLRHGAQTYSARPVDFTRIDLF
jgi:hypothetical protein